LIVEDDPMQQNMLKMMLQRKLGYESTTADNGRAALSILEEDQEKTIQLVILDLEMPVMNGMETLEILHQQYPDIAVVMLTGSQDVKAAVKAMKLGATDFLSKPYDGDRMRVTIENALKISALSKEVARLTHEKDGGFTFDHLIGHDGGLSDIIALGRKAASSHIPVLITGETGTGKEVFAKAIHGESPRADKPFIAVNCGAIPAQLIESTLFGHEKGAFTGATEKTIGKFREADGGTIFLDEVGELPLDAQVKLLRVLQQKEVEPVGASKSVHIDVRIISATNRNLEKEIEDGTFREDLFFRLNVLRIALPSLKNRKQDIPLLARHFIERYCAQNALPLKETDPSFYQALEKHNWPGNVRELESFIYRSLVLKEQGALKACDFNQTINNEIATPPQAMVDANTDHLKLSLLSENGDFKTIDVIEREALEAVIEYCDHNITLAAQTIGMAKSTFYKKIKD